MNRIYKAHIKTYGQVSAIQWQGDNSAEIETFIHDNTHKAATIEDHGDHAFMYVDGDTLILADDYWIFIDKDNVVSAWEDFLFAHCFTPI